MSFFSGLDKRQTISWAFYDFANSAYTLIVASFVFPIYFKEVVAGGGALGDLLWGIVVSTSILLGALAAPVIGAMADADGRRKRKFVFFTLLCIIGTAALFFAQNGALLLSAIVFIVANLSIEIAITLYDSFLSRVSTPATAGRVSGLGWGLGYLGGVLSMLLLRPLFTADTATASYHLTFPLVALFFLLFALPAFFFLRETRKPLCRSSVMAGFRRTFATVRDLRAHRRIAWFLVAFYFMNDALVTIFSFTPIYAKSTLGMPMNEIMVALIAVQLFSFVSTILIGWLSDHLGQKRILLAAIAGWMLVTALLAATTTRLLFWIVVLLTGVVIGSSQAIARSWFSRIVPQHRQAEFFGFNAFASKLSAVTGPLLFGFVVLWSGSERVALLALLPFFFVSFAIFSTLEEPERDARPQ